MKTIHDFHGIFIRMCDHNGLGKTIYFNGFLGDAANLLI
ncbi:hypothetical protein AC58_3889 [Escherichia coli 3-105-05_S3_C3]|nr:hypothetical protein AC58_3889 [Escherichia coli 3-105-05_S3_C3]